eukprot:jgi/Orpsp1_1/1181087/evm.model.c7180000075807.1
MYLAVYNHFRTLNGLQICTCIVGGYDPTVPVDLVYSDPLLFNVSSPNQITINPPTGYD